MSNANGIKVSIVTQTSKVAVTLQNELNLIYQWANNWKFSASKFQVLHYGIDLHDTNYLTQDKPVIDSSNKIRVL